MTPIYTYQCECGARFEESGRMKDHAKPVPCPDCKQDAPRYVPEKVSGVLKHPVDGPGPQNTGTSKDVDYDRVIGKSAEEGWRVQAQREEEKLRVVEEQGVEGGDLSMRPDGSYGVLEAEERGVHDRALDIHRKAMALREKKLGKGKKAPPPQ